MEQRILFKFEQEPAVQAAGYLLRKSGGSHHNYCLLKMLYLADRNMLVRHLLTLTTSNFVVLDAEPVPAEIYELSRAGGGVWKAHIRAEQDLLVLIRQTDTDWLSRASIQILDEVYAWYGELDPPKMRRLIRALPEYSLGLAEQAVLDPAAILRVALIPEETIQEMAENISLFNEIRANFGVE